MKYKNYLLQWFKNDSFYYYLYNLYDSYTNHGPMIKDSS